MIYDLIATATFGLEAVVGRELKQLGYGDLQIENSRVLFKGTIRDICRTNLWLRTADRVLIRFGEFSALSFDELFERTKALPWEELLPRNACFPVNGKSVKSKLFSVSDCQAIVKKAIVERLKQKYKQNWFEEDGPRYQIEVGLLKDMATITLDTSGVGLHKRGYRATAGDAPLKETLAAALVLLSYWNSQRSLVDPFCGSGTIPIEAALIGLNIAPGIGRDFDFRNWTENSNAIWDAAVEEAIELQKDQLDYRIQGYDRDPKVLKIARGNAQQAGVGEWIDFHARDIADFRSGRKYGCIITNPPYGQRLGEQREAEALIKTMRKVWEGLDTWSIYVLSACDSFERLYGKKAPRRRKLYNGRIKTTYYQYAGPRPPKSDDERYSINNEPEL